MLSALRFVHLCYSWAAIDDVICVMSKTEIIAELAKLTRRDRREILDRILELEEETEVLEDRRRAADETFQMLDALESEDAKNSAR